MKCLLIVRILHIKHEQKVYVDLLYYSRSLLSKVVLFSCQTNVTWSQHTLVNETLTPPKYQSTEVPKYQSYTKVPKHQSTKAPKYQSTKVPK